MLNSNESCNYAARGRIVYRAKCPFHIQHIRKAETVKKKPDCYSANMYLFKCFICKGLVELGAPAVVGGINRSFGWRV